MKPDPVGDHFDRVAPDYDRWKAKAHHYYAALKTSLREIVPPGSSVLEVGCATGDILASLAPKEGLGLDISPAMIEQATRKHPELRFRVHDLMRDRSRSGSTTRWPPTWQSTYRTSTR